jgi:hypothetical protein
MIRGLISNMAKRQNITVIFKHFADKAIPLSLHGSERIEKCNM